MRAWKRRRRRRPRSVERSGRRRKPPPFHLFKSRKLVTGVFMGLELRVVLWLEGEEEATLEELSREAGQTPSLWCRLLIWDALQWELRRRRGDGDFDAARNEGLL